MSIRLINLNEDLKKLKDENYNISIVNNNLVLEGIPYVNKERKILFGTLYCPLLLSADKTLPPTDHTAWFMGDHPCDQFGNENNTYVNSPQINNLTPEITGNYYFSSKPDTGNYVDFYEKMKKYIELLSAPAKSIDPSVSAQKFEYKEYVEDSVFKYPDTNSARAGISNISLGLKNQKIAIIGLGGTGAYVLDFVAKTPVAQIALFDGDDMLNHNAFRCPGAMTLEELSNKTSKVAYLNRKYSEFREGIVAYEIFIDESNIILLEEFDFVFLTIDKTDAKKIIAEYLITNGIPFADLGMNVSIVEESLRGVIRATLITPDNNKHLCKINMEKTNNDDLYSQNIQISELNALNAILGVISWKKLYGFYSTEDMFHNTTYILDEEVMYSET